MHDYNAYIVTDLGFGDSGKGTTVDTLTRALQPSLIVRHNGGCQAAHTVITPKGVKHTFNIFGSGSLSSPCPTLIGPEVVLHPLVMRREALELGGIHQLKRLFLSLDSKVTTTYHMAVNRLRELSRGKNRHGSCGIGFGETIEADINHPELTLRVRDCISPTTLGAKLYEIRGWAQDVASNLPYSEGDEVNKAWDMLLDAEEYNATIDLYPSIILGCNIADDSMLSHCADMGTVIFEGAQGVLIDEYWGFAPYNTWSDCTAANAVKMLVQAGIDSYCKLGVVRALPTRHGDGPFPTFNANLTVKFQDPNNPHNLWQGGIRVGRPDLVLLDYAVRANVGINGLVVTCMDQLDQLQDPTRIFVGTDYNAAVKGDKLVTLKLTLPDAEMTARMMDRFRPSFLPVERGDFLTTLSETVNAPVVMTSGGPRSDEKVMAEGWFQPSTCFSCACI